MADRRVEIKVDIVSDPNGTAKSKRLVGDLEKDVIASQKRIEANKKATTRAIIQSEEAMTRSSSANAKAQANAFISELNRTKAAAKNAGGEIQTSLNNAFKGFTIAGAVGGLAGGLVASFTAGLSQLPGIFKTQVDEMVRIASERQNAFKGLTTISNFLGISPKDTQDAVKNLRLVRAGVVDLGDATISLKNLLSSGFSLDEAVKLLEAFSDTAAFGKSAALGFGEAIKGATEGIRNGNSVLVDNVGLTKNLSVILKDAGFAEKDLMKVKDDHAVRQALLNGLLKEALPQLGDADRLTKGWSGSTSALSTAQTNLYAVIGDIIINNKQLIATVQTLTGNFNDMTGAVQNTETGWKKSIASMTTSFAEFVLSVTSGVRNNIAELQELLNYIKVVALAIPALDDKLSPWTGGEALRQYNEAISKIGTFTGAARAGNLQERSRYGTYLYDAFGGPRPQGLNAAVEEARRRSQTRFAPGDSTNPLSFNYVRPGTLQNAGGGVEPPRPPESLTKNEKLKGQSKSQKRDVRCLRDRGEMGRHRYFRKRRQAQRRFVPLQQASFRCSHGRIVRRTDRGSVPRPRRSGLQRQERDITPGRAKGMVRPAPSRIRCGTDSHTGRRVRLAN